MRNLKIPVSKLVDSKELIGAEYRNERLVSFLASEERIYPESSHPFIGFTYEIEVEVWKDGVMLGIMGRKEVSGAYAFCWINGGEESGS